MCIKWAQNREVVSDSLITSSPKQLNWKQLNLALAIYTNSRHENLILVRFVYIWLPFYMELHPNLISFFRNDDEFCAKESRNNVWLHTVYLAYNRTGPFKSSGS
jgi:hypothetical protein